MERSDLPLYTYYIDNKSKQLEGMLQNDIMFAEHKVKRRMIGGSQDSDPYIVLDPQDRKLVCIDECEIEMLDDSQLLSLIKVRKERNLIEDSQGVILVIPSLFLALFVTLLIVSALLPSLLGNPIILFMLSALLILAVISGYLAHRRLNSLMFFNRELLVSTINENPTFLESLRLLVESSSTKGWKKEEYRRELQYYEEVLSRINS